MHLRLLVAAVLAVWFGAMPAEGQENGVTQQASKIVERQKKTPRAAPETVAALRHAAQLLAGVKGLKGAPRKQKLGEVARLYEDVAAQHAADHVGSARAWFGAAEAWRRQGSLAKAEAAYLEAAMLDRRRYLERGQLGVAHMQRRQKKLEKALTGYRRLAAIKSDSAAVHEARLWVGRVLAGMGKRDQAIAAYKQALEVTKRPRRTIDVCNRLARVLIVTGDLAGAAAAIRRAEKAVPAGDGPDVARLRKALKSMSARRSLQRAIDTKTNAKEDARKLELERGRQTAPPCPRGSYPVPIP